MTVRGEESRRILHHACHKTTEFEGGGYRRQYMVGRGLSSDRVDTTTKAIYVDTWAEMLRRSMLFFLALSKISQLSWSL